MRILIAGIGNIFLGDDAFGVEVAARLARETLPEGVRVIDFGIRSYDLAMTLDQEWDAVLLVDAMPRGEAPGTLYVLEPENEPDAARGMQTLDPHAFGPMQVLAMLQTLEHQPRRLIIVGCEPAILETDELGLSPEVQAAIEPAVELIERLVEDFRSEASPEPPPTLAKAATS